ncbi:hypothetical protein TNCV_2628711 [Trichonephila clavipes]|uniref:Uncharacterized protein n=1 Tax=Trichonephila clavipes TaxID=2585209 RepID=A0A8X6V9P4_TRICX|nr:hypothetical protein TNCV_2628711 [Trichonephila clavipes]
MLRSGGQYDGKTPVFSSQANLVIHRPTEGMKGWVNLPSPRYTRAFGDGPSHFEPWSSDEDDSSAGTPSPNYHTNGTMFEFSTDLTCIASLRGGPLVVQGSNS